jgi:ketosteroid isomerase-like protein
MSQENVDAARRVYDAFSQRDLDAFLGLMDAEVEFTTRFVQLEGAPPSTAGMTASVIGGEICSRSFRTSAFRSWRHVTWASS